MNKSYECTEWKLCLRGKRRKASLLFDKFRTKMRTKLVEHKLGI